MRFLIPVFCLAATFNVHAYSGEELFDDLKSHKAASAGDMKAAMKSMRGQGYVDGAAQALFVTSHICPSTRISREQTQQVVFEYLEHNRDKRNMGAALLVTMALDTAFPRCKK